MDFPKDKLRITQIWDYEEKFPYQEKGQSVTK